MLVHRRLERQLARRIARLPKIRVGVDVVCDASRPVGDVLCFGVAPVVAARVVCLDGPFAAGAVHFFDQGGVGDGDGAEQVGGLGVGAGEVGDVGAGADGAGGAADWEGKDVSLGGLWWWWVGWGGTYLGRCEVLLPFLAVYVCVCD